MNIMRNAKKQQKSTQIRRVLTRTLLGTVAALLSIGLWLTTVASEGAEVVIIANLAMSDSAPSGCSIENSVLTINKSGTYRIQGNGAGTGAFGIAVAARVEATVILEDVEIEPQGSAAALSVGDNANVMLLLNGTSYLTGGNRQAGLQIAPGAAVTIAEESGAIESYLFAKGGSGAAGIGGSENQVNVGKLTIESGEVSGIGGAGASGIGMGCVNTSGGGIGAEVIININGGKVDGQAGNGTGAGIGADINGANACQITINGGVVKGLGRNGEVGIGGGNGTSIIVAGYSEVYASGGSMGVEALAGGSLTLDGACLLETNGVAVEALIYTRGILLNHEAVDTVYGEVSLPKDLLVERELKIAEGAVLTIDAATVLTVAENGKLTIAGGIVNNGQMDVLGALYVEADGALENHAMLSVAESGMMYSSGMLALAPDSMLQNAGAIFSDGAIGGDQEACLTGNGAVQAGVDVVLPMAVANGVYSAQLLPIEGARFSYDSGTVPKGLSIEGNMIAGKVSATAGVYNFGVLVDCSEFNMVVNFALEVYTLSNVIDLGNTATRGTCWTLNDNTYEIYGDVEISGRTATRNVKIMSTSPVTVMVAGETSIDVSAVSGMCAFDTAGKTVDLVLAGDLTLASGALQPGMKVENAAALTIAGDGVLTVTGGKDCAGIGGNAPGEVTIADVDVTIVANGGENGAGIGGNIGYGGGHVVIAAGRVEATGGANGAGIGGGYEGNGSTVTMSGGVLVAWGRNGSQDVGRGIGGARDETFNVTGGAVYVKSFGAAASGAREDCIFFDDKGNVTVYGEVEWAEELTVSDTGVLTVLANGKLTVKDGAMLTISESAQLIVEESAMLVNEGVITNAGRMILNGDMNNTGVIHNNTVDGYFYSAVSEEALGMVQGVGNRLYKDAPARDLGLALLNQGWAKKLVQAHDDIVWTFEGAGNLSDFLTMSIVDGYVVISGTPTAAQAGAYEFTITGRNGDLFVSAMTFELKVAGQNATIDVTDSALAGDGWIYDPVNEVYTVTGDVVITGATTSRRIVVANDSAITMVLNGDFNADLSGKDGACAMVFQGADVVLNVVGKNTLRAGAGRAALEVANGTSVVIDGNVLSNDDEADSILWLCGSYESINVIGELKVIGGIVYAMDGIRGNVIMDGGAMLHVHRDNAHAVEVWKGQLFVGGNSRIEGDVVIDYDVLVENGDILSVPEGTKLTVIGTHKLIVRGGGNVKGN